MIAFVVLSDGPSNRTLTIEGEDGRRDVCAASRTVASDDVVDLGGGFVAGPQWLESDGGATEAPVVGPGVDVTPAPFWVTFVAEDGSVISQQLGGAAPTSSPAPWSAALVEAADEQPNIIRITAEKGC